jgi:hypothetical protein
MNNIGLVITALFGWQRGKELLAGVDERYIRNFRFVVILTAITYAAFCGFAAYNQLHGAAAIGYIIVVVLGGLYISLSWQGLSAIAGLSVATKSLTPLKAIGYLALVFAIPTAVSEALMFGAITKPHMLFPLYVAGTVAGIYSLLWGGNVWFKRVVIFSAVFLAGKALVGMHYEQTETEKVAEQLLAQYEEQRDRNNATHIAKSGIAVAAARGELTPEDKRKLQFAKNGAPILKRISAEGEEFLGVIRVEYQVPSNIAPENLKPICGIPPGEYEFTLGGSPHLTLVVNDPVSGMSRTTLNIADWSKAGKGGVSYPEYIPGGMLLNDIPMRKKIVVGSDGCARPRFNWPENEIDHFRNRIFSIEKTTLMVVLR